METVSQIQGAAGAWPEISALFLSPKKILNYHNVSNNLTLQESEVC